jgi:hypothetical protein
MNINKILRVVVLGIVLITGAQTAGATGSCTFSVLVTAPLMTGEVPGSVIECTIVNVSDAPRDVTIKFFLPDGTQFGGSSPQTLEPGHAIELNTGVEGGGLFYYKFEVQGCKRHFRAAACIREPTGACTGPIPAQ